MDLTHPAGSNRKQIIHGLDRMRQRTDRNQSIPVGGEGLDVGARPMMFAWKSPIRAPWPVDLADGGHDVRA
jgi:hypothetical protein